ncbi:Acyl-coenzyme A dehydrogenase [compost metagenome]
MLAAEPLFEKICKADGRKRPFTQLDKVADEGLALGVINPAEADLLRRAEQSRLRTINVDDFDPIDLVANKALFEPSAYHRAA